MKAGLPRLSTTFFALLLGVSLGVGCKPKANNSNAGTSTTTTTTTTGRSQNTAPAANTAAPPVAVQTPSAAPSSEAHTPPDGSAERKAVLEGVRDYLKAQENFPNSVIENVDYLKVKDGWAFINCFAGAPDGEPYGSVEALLREQGGRWRVLEVLEYENDTEQTQRAAFRERHGDAPAEIFP